MSDANPALVNQAPAGLGRSGFDRGEGFTPGPWHIVVNKYGEQVLVEAPTDGTLFLLDDDEGIADHPTAEANARLIAAAPGLYAKLAALLRAYERACVDGVVTLNHETMQAEEEANEALAKARGEQSE
jgi:hypothetical protein